MPARIKLVLSLLAAAVSILMFILQRDLGNILPSYVCLLIGSLMILGIWIFPEVRKDR